MSAVGLEPRCDLTGARAMVKRDRPAVYPFAPIPFGAIVAAVFGITELVIAIRRLFWAAKVKASSSEFRCRPRDGDGSGMRGCLDEWDWCAVSTAAAYDRNSTR